MEGLDPQIEVTKALAKTGGNQAELARKLGVTRASVNEWVRTGRKYLPELQGHRFVRLFGNCGEEPQNPATAACREAGGAEIQNYGVSEAGPTEKTGDQSEIEGHAA